MDAPLYSIHVVEPESGFWRRDSRAFPVTELEVEVVLAVVIFTDGRKKSLADVVGFDCAETQGPFRPVIAEHERHHDAHGRIGWANWQSRSNVSRLSASTSRELLTIHV